MKINKVNEMNGITTSDLRDWMMEHGEDVVVDGPFRLSEEQRQMFLDKLNSNKKFLKKLRKDDGIEKGELLADFWDLNAGTTDESSEMLVVLFAEFLNEIGITEIPE